MKRCSEKTNVIKLFVFLPKSNEEVVMRYIAILLRAIFKAVLITYFRLQNGIFKNTT